MAPAEGQRPGHLFISDDSTNLATQRTGEQALMPGPRLEAQASPKGRACLHQGKFHKSKIDMNRDGASARSAGPSSPS